MKYISNSRAKTYRRCPKQYDFKYVYNLKPKRKSLHLEKGTWLHELLEVHYRGDDWEALHRRRVKEFNNLLAEIRDDLGPELPGECARIMRNYLRYWKEEDEQFVVVDTEMDEVVTLPNGLKFRVIVDLVVEDRRTGLLWPFDHKSRGKLESSDSMLLDPQLTNYFTALRILGYEPMGGVVYNELRTKVPTIPHLLKNGKLSKAKNIDTDVRTYYEAIKANGLEVDDYRDILRVIATKSHEQWFRRTKLPKDTAMLKIMQRELVVTANDIRRAERKGEFPRNFMTNDCKWSCDMKALCIAQLHGADISSLIKNQYRNRDELDEVEEKKK